MDIDDTIQVRCSRCKGKFRDKARRVRDGYSRQCPSCERLLFFVDGSPNTDINDALRKAEQVRKLLRKAEEEEASRPARRTPETAVDDPEATVAISPTDRRVRGSGRTTISSR